MTSRPDKKITILFINLYTEMGGGEYVIYYLLKELNRSRYEPVMMFNQRGAFVEKVEALGVRTVIVPYQRMMLKELVRPAMFFNAVKASQEIQRFLKQNPIDIIHCSDVLSLAFVAVPVLRFRIPLVYNVVFFYEWTRIIAFNILALFTVRMIVAHSLAVKKDLINRTLWLKRRIEVIHPGVDTSVYYPQQESATSVLRRELGIGENIKLIGMIARYEPTKGHHLFLQAASFVLKERNDVKFVIIGSVLNADTAPSFRKYYDEILKLQQEMKLGDGVLFIPQRDDLPAVMRGLDLVVCQSLSEGFGLIVLEALASGVPVVLTETVSALEVVRHFPGVTVAKPNNASSLGECVLKSLEEKDRNPKEFSGTRAWIREEGSFDELSWRCHARKVENLYTTLMKE
ncbi:MAG: glycosyltransferase family 4 protein [Ignavibacteria bacterium]|nr:glycosyltransferase family 4 protein [Ignavibacteria bacterium]